MIKEFVLYGLDARGQKLIASPKVGYVSLTDRQREDILFDLGF